MCPAPLGTKVHSHELKGPTSPYKRGKSGQGFHLLSNDRAVMRTIQGSKEMKPGAVFPGLPASGQAGEIDEKASRASSLFVWLLKGETEKEDAERGRELWSQTWGHVAP